jgi:hypothetical protein
LHFGHNGVSWNMGGVKGIIINTQDWKRGADDGDKDE